METGQIIAIAIPVVVAILGILKAYFANKGKKELAAVVDAVIDGIEVAGDEVTKKAVAAFAETRGVATGLNKALDKAGYRKRLENAKIVDPAYFQKATGK